MASGRRVLLLGSSGMLGHALAEAFGDWQLVTANQPTFDITQQENVEQTIRDAHPNVILNATGYTAVDAAEVDEARATAINGTGVGFVAHAAREVGAALVHYSTDYVFDGTEEAGYAEGAPRKPLSAYGRSKAAGEVALEAAGARAYLIRTSWLYGQFGKNFVETMMTLAAEKPRLQVVDDQVGKPTLTTDLALATRSLLLDEAPLGTYHLVNEGTTSWYNFAREIFRQAGVDVELEPVTTAAFPRPAPRPHWSALTNTKRPLLRPWAEALTDYLRTRR